MTFFFERLIKIISEKGYDDFSISFNNEIKSIVFRASKNGIAVRYALDMRFVFNTDMDFIFKDIIDNFDHCLTEGKYESNNSTRELQNTAK